jgi:hypothetical protein
MKRRTLTKLWRLLLPWSYKKLINMCLFLIDRDWRELNYPPALNLRSKPRLRLYVVGALGLTIVVQTV